MSYPEDFDDLVLSNKAELARLEPHVQVAYCIHQFEAEVNNGGFDQFFTNSTGEYVRETIQALTDIGATKTCNLLRRAVAIGFPGGYPADASVYESAFVGDGVEGLDPLDEEFYRYAEPLADLVNAYLARGI